MKRTETNPDIVLISSKISDSDILEVIKEIIKSSPEIKIVVMARLGEKPSPLNLLKAGVKACLDKSISASDLVKSLELISGGRIIIGPAFAQEFVADINTAEEADNAMITKVKASLSKREIEIAKLIVEGANNKELAQKLFIAENTVKVHVKNILKKLELRNRQQLAAYTVLQNWTTAEEENNKE